MRITVVGPGRWGSFIAWYLDRAGHEVSLYGRPGSASMRQLKQSRHNACLTLPDSVQLSESLQSVAEAEVVVIAMPSQALRGFLASLSEQRLQDKIFVLCMKGLEIGSGKRLSVVASEMLDASNRIAVWIGPGHVQEFYAGIPNCMVIDSEEQAVKQLLVEAFSTDLIRFYYGSDLIGNEIGAASKNVIGIAAGMLDGFGLATLKGPLMSRGTREIARLIKAMGGSELSAYGLCHLGDYEATVFSEFSHNRQFGESFVKGEAFEKLAEGYYTVQALMELADAHQVELPICRCVYEILYHQADPRQELNTLFTRSLKNEF
ncbi:MAG: NAD(P)H-dependent glycerol-3-phosphate dehydrogenase [Lachnospiraceae bacterium]|jgi:glycerol-3-phosphate dehydrogenase (NAD(P)+)|nr:NAD(P)H-dependent glycerol-3-phosphate dehydrogenase [Lachnospiraceae bacterium]